MKHLYNNTRHKGPSVCAVTDIWPARCYWVIMLNKKSLFYKLNTLLSLTIEQLIDSNDNDNRLGDLPKEPWGLLFITKVKVS